MSKKDHPINWIKPDPDGPWRLTPSECPHANTRTVTYVDGEPGESMRVCSDCGTHLPPAPTMTKIEEHERDAVIRAIVTAITDEGSHSEYHRAVSRLCREEWPALFAALDRLVTLETRGDKQRER